ncbi:MAG: NUDIX hydrolase [Planctomycetes bacterium]|nr:NUDIX hydrolase [Planctomycetota bacterium]
MRDMQTRRPDFIGVYGWLEEQGSVLLVATYRDLGTAGKQLCWELPGGKIEKGETDEEAMRREMREETGLDVAVNGLLFMFVGERFTKGKRRYGWEGHFYSLNRAGGELRPDGEETVDAKMVPVADLTKILTAPYHSPILRWLASGRTLKTDVYRWEDK